MYRVFALIINMFASVVLNTFFQADVSVNINAPMEVVAGTEFDVNVVIDKGDLATFSRLQLDLPAGLKASSVANDNADFSHKEKKVRFNWLKMPAKNQLQVTFKVKVDQRLKGTFSLDGKFSFIDDNERRAVDVVSQAINIIPSRDTDPSLIVDIADYERLIIPYISPASADPKVACVRQKPELNIAGDAYIVTLLVSKERKERFAKIEETIPNGFTAVSIDPHDANFIVKGNTAKFLWMNLPVSSLFLVSYKLVPKSKSAKLPEISGEFSYLEEDKTHSIPIQQTGQNVAQVKTIEELNMLLASIPSEAAILAQSKTGAQTTDKKPNETSNRQQRKVSKSNTKYKLEPEEGIYYRVQLAAGHKPIEVKRYFKKYKLDKEVRIEVHDGWNKYSIGSFPLYREARDYRVHIWNTTAIDDAFVSAYNNGSRITVQEALMVANQIWYK